MSNREILNNFRRKQIEIIRIFRSMGYKEETIARYMNISVDRIIKLAKYRKVCYVHKGATKDRCWGCDILKKKTRMLKKYPILNELIKHKRDAETVKQREKISKKLRYKENLSLLEIGKIMERDHTTIMNLLNK